MRKTKFVPNFGGLEPRIAPSNVAAAIQILDDPLPDPEPSPGPDPGWNGPIAPTNPPAPPVNPYPPGGPY